MIGTSFGRYQVIESLGRGGMGEVHLAEDPALGRKVAIKVLPAEFRNDLDRRQRLLHEARAASALNHPNIVVIYDIGEADASLFVAMEVVDGETLREWSRSKEHPPREVVALARQAAAALAVAHAAGLVHRDLKPENLMVRRDGLLKILDFGLARSVSPEASDRTATMPGLITGTVPYMSPEQVLGQPAGPASDLFALGTILYELLTGRHPFEGENAIDTMHRILHETPGPPSQVNAGLSADFDFVLTKLLAKDPKRRHASARDLDVDLETLECGCGPAASIQAEASAPRALAVLPFKNIGGDPSLGYLGMGFADAVITRLSASPDLIVRATGTVSRYLDQPVDPRLVGQELQAEIVLDASFQRAGERLRATARLVEAVSGRSLWAGKIDVRFDDIFEVQDQVANGIAEALTARLTARSPSGTRRGVERFVPSPDAYRHFMKGVELHGRADEKGVLDAIEELETAVRREPDYALAWAHLGFAYHSLVDGGLRHEPEWYDKAAAALARAVALDPDDGQVRHLMAAQHIVHGRKRETYRELIASVARVPHFWSNYHYAAYLFRICDLLDECLLAEERCLEVEPNLPWAYGGMCRTLQLLGRHDEARVWADRYVQRNGEFHRSQVWIARGLVIEGRFAEVCEASRTGRFRADSGRYMDVLLAIAECAAGDRDRARAHIARFEPMASIDMDAAAEAAAYHALSGDVDRAFRHLGRATELGNDSLRFYENPHLFGTLHSHPGWSPFIAGVRARVSQWRREFRWPLPGE